MDEQSLNQGIETGIPMEPQETPDIKEESKPQTTIAVVVNCNKLNVRSKPNIKSDVVCIVDAGKILTVNGASNGWARVYVDYENEARRGYVMTDYIAEER